MRTDTDEDFPHRPLRNCWLQEFQEGRIFDRQAHFEPYMSFIKRVQATLDESDDSEDEEEDEEEDEGEIQNDSGGDEDEIGGDGEDLEDKDEDPSNGNEAKVCNECGIVRAFMKGTTEDEERLQYDDQVEEVASFVEKAMEAIAGTGVDCRPAAALLDYRNCHGTSVVKRGCCRPGLGPLTSADLGGELSREYSRLLADLSDFSSSIKYSTLKVDQSDSSNRETRDAERREQVIFVTDADASTIEALVPTAPLSRAQALKDLFYTYLKSKTTIGVAIPSQGFRTFTLHFNMPHYVLKESMGLQDHRKKTNDKPLRQSWNWPFLAATTMESRSSNKINKKFTLYEAQISIAVTGIDESVWTAYCFVETYFGSTESVDRYHRQKTRSFRPDPIAAGQIDMDLPQTPREYFLKVIEIRIKQVRREWDRIIDKIESEVQRFRDHVFPNPSSDRKTRDEVRELSNHNCELVKILKQLINRLSDTVGAWNDFKQKEVEYFLYEGKSAAASPPSLQASIISIDKAYLEMKVFLRKLEGFEKELCDGNPQGLHAHLVLENNDAAMFQQRTSKHVMVLTVITVIFYPLVIATSIFSTQGVLPFKPNFAYFIYVLLFLVVLVLIALVVLCNLDSWFQLIVDFMRAMGEFRRKTIKDKEEARNDEENNSMSSPSGDLRQGIPLRRLRGDVRTARDLERGESGMV